MAYACFTTFLKEQSNSTSEQAAGAHTSVPAEMGSHSTVTPGHWIYEHSSGPPSPKPELTGNRAAWELPRGAHAHRKLHTCFGQQGNFLCCILLAQHCCKGQKSLVTLENEAKKGSESRMRFKKPSMKHQHLASPRNSTKSFPC